MTTLREMWYEHVGYKKESPDLAEVHFKRQADFFISKMRGMIGKERSSEVCDCNKGLLDDLLTEIGE